MTTVRTSWASGINPITNKPAPAPITAKGLDPHTGKIPLKEIPVPSRPLQRKGRTKYDEEFEKLLAGKTALQMHESNYQTMRRALQRFIVFRGLTGKVAVRQQTNTKTRMVAVWLEQREDV